MNMSETEFYCNNCGVRIKPTDVTCPNCGKNLSEVDKTIKKTITETIGISDSVTYQVKPMNRSEKAKLAGKFLAAFLISLIAVISVFAILLFVIGFFPDYIPIPNANDLLNILINTDGILLGFVGIVFAQLLSSIMDQQNILYERILEKPNEAAENMKSLEFMDARKYGLSLITIVTFGSLLGSIFVSMANIAKNSKLLPTDTYATFGILFGPLLYTIMAVILLTLALAVLPLRPPLEKVQKDNQTKT